MFTAEGNGTLVWHDGTEGDTYTFTAGSTTEIYVTVSSACGNVAGDTTTINVGETPMVDAGMDTTINEGDSHQIDATTNGTGIIWTPFETLDCSDCEDPIATPDSTTVYYISVVSNDGCQQWIV